MKAAVPDRPRGHPERRPLLCPQDDVCPHPAGVESPGRRRRGRRPCGSVLSRPVSSAPAVTAPRAPGRPGSRDRTPQEARWRVPGPGPSPAASCPPAAPRVALQVCRELLLERSPVSPHVEHPKLVLCVCLFVCLFGEGLFFYGSELRPLSSCAPPPPVTRDRATAFNAVDM